MQYVLIAYALLKHKRAFKSIYIFKVLKNKAFKSIYLCLYLTLWDL